MSAATSRVLGDGHVHLHPEASLARLLATARARAAAADAPLVLLLAEIAGAARFPALHAAATRGEARPDAGTTRLEPTCETASLRIPARAGRGDVFLVAGRQLVSRERLEVLALALEPAHALHATPDASVPARELLARALDAGALAVLPWGFGKWLGARGRAVAALVERPELSCAPLFFLGDVPQRPRLWPAPRVFRRGVRFLPGSDPLPLPGVETGVARYGFTVPGTLDPERPAASLVALLAKGDPVARFGCRDGALTALGDQLRYRLRARA